VKEMMQLHEKMLTLNPRAYLLVLTGNPHYLQAVALENVIIKKVPADEVPRYLSIAHVGLALRKATLSMQGVAPIKLGEYLLLGLPVIASAGIGDTQQLIENKSFCYLMEDHSDASLNEALQWIIGLPPHINREEIRTYGIAHFGLQKAIDLYRTGLTFIR
jgi:glycosyltransferase involved in cell wall biosynthesis